MHFFEENTTGLAPAGIFNDQEIVVIPDAPEGASPLSADDVLAALAIVNMIEANEEVQIREEPLQFSDRQHSLLSPNARIITRKTEEVSVYDAFQVQKALEYLLSRPAGPTEA